MACGPSLPLAIILVSLSHRADAACQCVRYAQGNEITLAAYNAIDPSLFNTGNQKKCALTLPSNLPESHKDVSCFNAICDQNSPGFTTCPSFCSRCDGHTCGGTGPCGCGQAQSTGLPAGADCFPWQSW